MKKLRLSFITICMMLSVVTAKAEGTPSLRDLFRQMPDSLLPYLTQTNRLDFIDFIDSKMKAEVRNALDGTSEMTVMTDDSLSIRLSEASTVDIHLLQAVEQPADSCQQVICVVRTWSISNGGTESRTEFYSTDWKPLNTPPALSAADQRRIESWNQSTILKTIEEILNKQ